MSFWLNWLPTRKGRRLVSFGIQMIGEITSACYLLRPFTSLASKTLKDWSEPTASFANKLADGIGDRNKFGKLWEQTKVTARLVVSYFNWIWRHSRTKDTAAQRAGIAVRQWYWQDMATYQSLL